MARGGACQRHAIFKLWAIENSIIIQTRRNVTVKDIILISAEKQTWMQTASKQNYSGN